MKKESASLSAVNRRSAALAGAQNAFELLFLSPDAQGKLQLPDSPLLALIFALLRQPEEPSAPGEAGKADCLNALLRLARGGRLEQEFIGEIFNAFAALRVLPEDLKLSQPGADADFLLEKALELCRTLKKLPSSLRKSARERLLPQSAELFASLPQSKKELTARILAGDPFAVERVFGYRNGRFTPLRPDSVKEVKHFFGFAGVRAAYSDHFSAFAAGKTNLPLLVNSLPGYGKTSMILSFALAAPEVVVILPEPEALESGWRELTASLAKRKDHRFVLFFDDIDPAKVDWYSFRTNVGGAFAPPENVMPVLAANYEFPPSILSRGRKISYPVFDELRCVEMIEDFLKGFGMHRPPANLVSFIGADYTEEFGQKHFTELSPRTLMRYLKIYETDQNKRRTMVSLASGQLIQKPDAELFYEFNIEVMRSLYGEDYIKRLLKERLKEL